MYRKLFSNFAYLSFIQGINFLLPLLITPYLISKVGIEGFGVIAIAQTLMIYLSTVSEYGLNISATRKIVFCLHDQQKLSKAFFTFLAVRIVITVILFLLLGLLISVIPFFKTHILLFTFAYSFVFAQAFVINWFFMGVEKMRYVAIFSFISKAIFITLVLIVIKSPDDAKWFLVILALGNLVAAIISIVTAIKRWRLKWSVPSRTDIIFELKSGWQVMVSTLSLNTYLLSGIFILRIFTSDLVIGYYSVAVRIFMAARQVMAVFSEAVYPHLCRLFLQGRDAARPFFKNVYLPFLSLTVLGCAALFIFAPQLVFIFLKAKPSLPILLLRILSFAPVIVCLNIPAYQLLIAFDKKRSYMRVFGFATTLNIIANILLANAWGSVGTVLSIIITELFITVGLTRQLYKNNLLGYTHLKFI